MMDEYESEFYRYASSLSVSDCRKWTQDYLDNVLISHTLHSELKKWTNIYFTSDLLLSNLDESTIKDVKNHASMELYSCLFAGSQYDQKAVNVLRWLDDIYIGFLRRAKGDTRERIINTLQNTRNENVEKSLIDKTNEQNEKKRRFPWSK
jgi:hypothetical protein